MEKYIKNQYNHESGIKLKLVIQGITPKIRLNTQFDIIYVIINQSKLGYSTFQAADLETILFPVESLTHRLH
jgi:hypothetical protein